MVMTVQTPNAITAMSNLLMAIALAISACSQPEAEQRTQTMAPEATEVSANPGPTNTKAILIDGSSTVFPITRMVAEAFRQTDANSPPIDVSVSGTSGGFRRFCAGETDVSNASRPILIEEMVTCNQAGVRFIELPVAFDAITVVVNPQNTWAKAITMGELRKVWEPAAQGKITTWKQVNPVYPDKPLVLFGPGKDSGTYDYFNEVVTGNPKGSRQDYTASEDDEVLVRGVEGNPTALGYFGFAYFEKHQARLKALPVDSGKGAISPSRETVERGTYQPFSRPLFIYVNARAVQEKPSLQKFVTFYLTNAKTIVPKVGYIPLPEEAYHIGKVQFFHGKVGTVFEGVPQPNVTLSELLRRQKVFQLNAQSEFQEKAGSAKLRPSPSLLLLKQMPSH
jgi:phosphate transport system substrate-binding protein